MENIYFRTLTVMTTLLLFGGCLGSAENGATSTDAAPEQPIIAQSGDKASNPATCPDMEQRVIDLRLEEKGELCEVGRFEEGLSAIFKVVSPEKKVTFFGSQVYKIYWCPKEECDEMKPRVVRPRGTDMYLDRGNEEGTFGVSIRIKTDSPVYVSLGVPP